MLEKIFYKTSFLVGPIVLAVLALSGCTSSQNPSKALERHPIHGVIQSLDTASKTATIKHGDIPGFMHGMTMEFPIKANAEFAKLRTGEKISGTVFVADTDFWVGDIKEEK